MKFKMRMILCGFVLLSLAGLTNSQTLGSANGNNSDSSCCIGIRGDLNGDGQEGKVLDLTYMINDIFRGGPPPACLMEGDLNIDGQPSTVLDLTYLVNWIFRGGPAAGACGTGISTDARMAVVDEVTHLLDSLVRDPNAYSKIQAYLNARPEIDTAVIVNAPGTVWAMFTDSVLLFVSNNRLPTGPSRIAGNTDTTFEPILTRQMYEIPSTKVGPVPLPENVRIPNSGLPSSTDAVFMNTLGSNFYSPITQTLANWLGAKGYGAYTGQETVEALRNISDVGVLFFSTHGGAGYFEITAADSAYSLWTSSIATKANLPTYMADLRAKRLSIQVGIVDVLPNGDTLVQAHYGITSKFVNYYWPSFPNNAMVYIDACGSDGPFAQPFKRAILAKNAGVYFGWTYSMYSDASNLLAQFLIDRLLGANLYQSYKENPPQRPFDYVSIFQDLQSRNLLKHPTVDSLAAPGGFTEFKYTAGAGDFGLLVPSIRYMAVVEHFDTLYVTGFFGSDPGARGRVIVGGTELLIYSWEPWLIQTFIPNTGVGSVGPVTVEIDGMSGTPPLIKRSSNVVNLTQWEGVFTYTEAEAGSLVGTIAINAKLRADIHPFRDFPHTTPGYYSVIFPAMENSYGTATGSGTYSYTYADSDPVNTDTWTWDGSHYLPGLFENDPTGFLLTGEVVAASKILKLRLVAAESEGLTETLVNDVYGFQHTNPISFAIPFDLYDTFPELFNINMNNVWDILGSQRVLNTCCSNFPDYVDDVEHKLMWPTIPASWAPDTTAAQ